MKNTILFRRRDFGLVFLGMTIVEIAAQIEAVTVGWQIYSVARLSRSIEASAFLVGMVGLAQFLPLFFLSLYAGSVADHHSRKRIVVASLVVEVLSMVALTAHALTPGADIRLIFVVVATYGAARAFLSPAASALVPMLVPREEMPQAISLKSLSWQAAVIIGPWIGGLLCALSAALSFAVAGVLYTAGLAVLLLIRTNTTPQRPEGSRIAQIVEGLRYVWTEKIVIGAISLDLFAVLFGGVTALLPAYAADVLQVGPHGFGLLRSGPAIGACVVAMMLARWPLKRKAGIRMFLAVGAFGVATLVFALSRSMTLSVVALACLGAADMVSVFVRQTLVQVVTPDHMRGRVASVSGLFVSGSNELGEFESGVAARILGPVGAAVFGGIGTIVVTLLWARLFPALRQADRLDGRQG